MQTLLISCRDRPGLIHLVTGVLLDFGLNIVVNGEFVDSESGSFFMRTEFTGAVEAKELTDRLQGCLPGSATIRLAGSAPKDVVIFGGKEAHCVGDLLMRFSNSELNVRIQAVLSNHGALRGMVERFGVAFHEVPCEQDEKRQVHEERLLSKFQALRPDFLVLAKYMRVLTPEFIHAWPHRIINIHHSFLPAFIGAQPYRQAFERGVKIIGASAHFVTEKLDEGPIIVQSVLPVTHADTARSMAREGREIEKIVLARALQLIVEDRVFVHGNRTIIFE